MKVKPEILKNIGDIVYLNEGGVSAFGDLMFKRPAKITKVWRDKKEYSECKAENGEHIAKNCTCNLYYEIEALDFSRAKLDHVLFDEINIIKLK